MRAREGGLTREATPPAQGVWTLQKKGEHATMSVAYEDTRPTRAHLALCALVKARRVKHIVSQNVDGLHLRSGVPAKHLTELHGNIYSEACPRCGRRFLRPFQVTTHSSYHHHQTARTCALKKCKGQQLRDTIIYFGEKLEDHALDRARAESDQADLVIFFGTSLKVLQHYKFIFAGTGSQGTKKMVIINLQWTPKDRVADLKIHGTCDAVLDALVDELRVAPASYRARADPIACAPCPEGAGSTSATKRPPPRSRAFPTGPAVASPKRPRLAGRGSADGAPTTPSDRESS